MTENRKMDVRTVHRYLHKGLATSADYDQHLAGLPDLAEQAEFIDYETQFREEEARRLAEEARAEALAAAAPPPAPAVTAAYAHSGHGAPPATVAPASVAPSAVASVPNAAQLSRPNMAEDDDDEDLDDEDDDGDED
jgi:hypothetical protein